MRKRPADHNDKPTHRKAEGSSLTRRSMLAAVGGGLASAGLPGFITMREAKAADPGAPPDLAAARKEGPLVLWHGDQEADVIEFLKAFTKKTGIEATQQRLLPGAALPKLEAEFRAGATDVDVYDTSDSGIMDNLRQQGRLLQYKSTEMAGYEARYKSEPEGYWTTYFVNVGPMMYDSRYVKEAEAPKTYADLLDPRWKGQIGFQNASAGSQYAWWFLLKDVLPKDFWDKLAAQKPRAYASSTQIITDVHRGDLKIGGKVSSFQYPKSLRKNLPVKAIFPPEGTPAQNQVTGIIAATKRPNAAKAYVDFLLSREGQILWNEVQGSYSARSDVPPVAGLPPIASLKILIPTPATFEAYKSTAAHAEFVKVWNKIVGF